MFKINQKIQDQNHTILIVNADDFGISDSVNAGILESHFNGIVTSTTMLANGPAFEQGVAQLQQAPRLGVGVHLNILRGRPILAANTLPHITRQGRFHLTWKRLIQVYDRRILLEIEREYRAQIEKVLSHGIAITHLDSEKHHHHFPPLFQMITHLLESYPIPAIRCAPESLSTRYGLTKMASVFMLNILVWRNRFRLRSRAIRCPQHQTGIAMTGSLDLNGLKAVLQTLPPGVNELCCHPGRVDALHKQQIIDFGTFYIDSTRETEMSALTNPSIKQMLLASGIKLISYAELP
ncbi:MAG: ChbG/HpnK family deacetylase [Magnetococcales bacterium]|nr:ChbG/HpnK family deacetylase [Magnetococcales bacterium]